MMHIKPPILINPLQAVPEFNHKCLIITRNTFKIKFTTTFLSSLINLQQVSVAFGLILATIMTLHGISVMTLSFDFKNKHKDWDSVAGIVTCYGLDSPGFKPWWKQDFLDSSGLAPRPNQPPE